MAKQCGADGCNNPVFSNGFCGWHQSMRTDNKWIKSLEKKANKVSVKKKYKSFNPVSQKRIDALARYRPIRDQYLIEHPICEVKGCVYRSNHIHHKMGREHNAYADDWARDNDIPLLIDVRFFMAVNECHHPKAIHENPEWARENGYLI